MSRLEELDRECWGALLQEGGGREISVPSSCDSFFHPGSKHLKNKFCYSCHANGIMVPASRVKTIAKSAQIENLAIHGPWNSLATPNGPLHYRLVNHTTHCTGYQLLIFRDAPPEDGCNGTWQTSPIQMPRRGCSLSDWRSSCRSTHHP